MTVRRNIVANYVGQIFSSALALALVPVYIRYLTIEAYALVGFFAVAQAWLALLDLGMAPTLNREMARFTAGAVPVQFIRDLLRSLELTCLVIAVAVAGALTILSDVVATRWLSPGHLAPGTVADALSLIGVVVGLRFCEGIYRSGLIGLQQQVWLNGASVIMALIRGGGAVLLLSFVSPTIHAFFLWQAFVSILTLVVTGAKLHFSLPPAPRRARFSVAALVEVRRFAGGMFGITLLGVLLTQVDKLLLSRLLPLAEYGYYMLASTLTGGLLLVSGPVVQAAYPALVRLYVAGDERHLAQTYHRTCQLISIVLAPAALVIVLFSRGVLFGWSGSGVLADHAAVVLAMLTVGTFFNALMQMPHHLQLAAGWTSLVLRMNLMAVLMFVPLLLWVAPRYGAPAAAVCWALLNIGYVLFGVPLLHQRLLKGELASWWGRDVLLPVLGASLGVGLAWLARPGVTADRLTWLLFLVGAGLVGLIGAVLGANLYRAQLFQASRYALARTRRRTTRSS